MARHGRHAARTHPARARQAHRDIVVLHWTAVLTVAGVALMGMDHETTA
ncbi:hypothetical protein [Candidatus Accumulibacter sp. ACC007]|nr:hypothetical protein [Candidatus Accumulibacter sp. ACC007]